MTTAPTRRAYGSCRVRRALAPALAIVVAMPDEDSDPIANTQMFRRFAQQPEPGSARRASTPLVLGLVVLALLLAGVVVWLAAR